MSFFLQDSVPWSAALQDRSVIHSLVVDLGLVALFTIQHSLLAWSPVKQALQSALGVLTRTAYCFTTALALQVKHLGLSEKDLYHANKTCFLAPPCIIINLCLTLSDLDALLEACDWRPLPVVSPSCTLEHMVASDLLCTALPVLGHHLQHPHALRLPRAAGHQAGNQGCIRKLQASSKKQSFSYVKKRDIRKGCS